MHDRLIRIHATLSDTLGCCNVAKQIPTDVCIVTLPHGIYANLNGRSSMTTKGLIVLQQAIIDNTDNITVVVWNTSKEDYLVKVGDRIGQLVFPHYATPNFVEAK